MRGPRLLATETAAHLEGLDPPRPATANSSSTGRGQRVPPTQEDCAGTVQGWCRLVHGRRTPPRALLLVDDLWRYL